jgi:hypothetical protein
MMSEMPLPIPLSRDLLPKPHDEYRPGCHGEHADEAKSHSGIDDHTRSKPLKHDTHCKPLDRGKHHGTIPGMLRDLPATLFSLFL